MREAQKMAIIGKCSFFWQFGVPSPYQLLLRALMFGLEVLNLHEDLHGNQSSHANSFFVHAINCMASESFSGTLPFQWSLITASCSVP